MPSGVVSIASTLMVGYGVRHTSNRWAWIAACCVPGILGGGLMSFDTGNKAGQLAGIYLVNFITATLIVIYQWTGANVAGQTKRVVSVVLISGSFSVGNIIGPQTFRANVSSLPSNFSLDAYCFVTARHILILLIHLLGDAYSEIFSGCTAIYPR